MSGTMQTTLPGPGQTRDGKIQATLSGPGAIAGNHISQSGSGFSMSGDFASPAVADGTYSFVNYPVVVNSPYPPFVCVAYFTQTGSWTATAP